MFLLCMKQMTITNRYPFQKPIKRNKNSKQSNANLKKIKVRLGVQDQIGL